MLTLVNIQQQSHPLFVQLIHGGETFINNLLPAGKHFLLFPLFAFVSAFGASVLALETNKVSLIRAEEKRGSLLFDHPSTGSLVYCIKGKVAFVSLLLHLFTKSESGSAHL